MTAPLRGGNDKRGSSLGRASGRVMQAAQPPRHLSFVIQSDAVGCESSLAGQSRMYALSIRFSKFWLSTTALATS